MEFKGTKGEWQMSNVKNESDCNNTSIYCEKGNTIAVVNWYKRTACFGLNYREEVAVVRTQGDYNALLISKEPILLDEHFKEDVEQKANILLFYKAHKMLEMLKHISEQMEIAWRRYDNEDAYDLGQIFDDIDLEGLDNLIKESTEL